MTALLARVQAYLETGGPVMWPLVGLGLALWLLLALRATLLATRTPRGDLDRVLADAARGRGPAPSTVVGRSLRRAAALLTDGRAIDSGTATSLIGDARLQAARFRRPIRAMVAAAPLLGLLGTVAGMIQTFDYLAERVLFAQGGGVAGGISAALASTQLGLVVAIPAFFAARVLDRRETRARALLDRLDVRLRADVAPRGA